ncbi:hypothetical protein CcrC1_gp366 [Caulobacter phage C1]|nr:hypothetical protein CcrC1_gp366 [Caulobacter phage C1]UTU08595.1 hypothetical protein CcrC2_gp367 [Caulobacter phage C2]UTU09111.1 hypothetical protein CcrJ4_gp362 [Caulobacter phage J4]UTU10228.1 hypothetical protein CcrRB23_gp366 [Caulobacter phage RB23]WGN97262.1 hypothetical protein [Bertelyvirus sp.]
MATKFKVALSDVMQALDLNKLNIVGAGYSTSDLNVMPADLERDNGLADEIVFLVEDDRLPDGETVELDLKFHSDGSVTLLRIGDLDVQDEEGGWD